MNAPPFFVLVGGWASYSKKGKGKEEQKQLQESSGRCQCLYIKIDEVTLKISEQRDQSNSQDKPHPRRQPYYHFFLNRSLRRPLQKVVMLNGNLI